VVLAAPELVEAEPIEVFGEVDVALELQHRVLARRVVGGDEGSETQAGHAVMVGSTEIDGATGPPKCNDLAMAGIDLRAPVEGDLEAIARVVDAQDTAWWGAPDGDLDDVRDELERVRRATGSLDVGARVAVVEGAVVGVAMSVGHGHTSVAVDSTDVDASVVRRALFRWLAEFGDDVQIDAPAQDVERLSDLAALGFTPLHSSFELERPGDVADLPDPMWPDGIVPVPFGLGVDDEELHEMIYSFWTDVPGHTYRPIDEWRSSILAGQWFDPHLVVLARSDDSGGPIQGCALTRTFTGGVGWVSQLGVARSARGLGLGRALLIEACRRLGVKEPRIIGLGVEAENANALGLYRSVGFEIAREWIHCSRR
jgi:mycothiol synthase